ncbi:MAG: TonB family protein [Holophagales bacterium]|nr:TonB family protein [Holophagales bacterium]
MSSTGTIPRLFGPYVLTRHLGADPLGAVYRAGTASGPHLAPLLLIRVFDGAGVDEAALVPSMEDASEYLEVVRGPAVAKGAVLGIVEDVPFAGIEYVPGRTLDRLFSGEGQGSIPLPVEHALLIAEKLLVALEAGKPFEKKMGAPHGFLTPGFVTISNDGDIRVYGAGLGAGLLPSLKKPAVLEAFGPYIAPEVLASGKPSAAGDIYSAAAILLQALTGKVPVPGAGTDALAGAVLAVDGSPMPADLASLVSRGLAKDPNQREKDVVAYRKTLGKLLYGGPYAPSTFNLAFFMHQRFERAIDKERKELAQEETIDPKPLAAAEERKDKEIRDRARAARAAASVSVPSFGAGTSPGTTTMGGTPVPKKAGLGGIPVPVVAGGVLAVLGVAGWFLFGRGGAKQPAAPQPTPVAVVAPTPMPAPTPMMVGKEDPAFQAALQAKLQEEMKKVEGQIVKEQAAAARRRAEEQAKLEEAAQKTREAEEAVRLASDRADKEEAERLAKEAADARSREDAARKAAEAASPKVNAGDLVDIGQVSKPPQATKIVKPEATNLARSRKVSGTVLVRVLVDENGRAAQAEVYRDTNPRVGLGESSLTAVKQWEWTPATKDGVKVKTWIVVPLPFVLK